MSSPIIIASDSFAGSDVNPLSSPWTTVTSATALQQVSNEVRVAAVNASIPAMARYGAFNARVMRTTATVVNHSSGQIGVGVRCSSTAQTLYIAVFTTVLEIFKFVAGSFTALDFVGVSYGTSGDTISCTANGSDISASKNGTIELTKSDSTIESGTWALRIFEPTTLGDNELDNVVMETYEPVFMGAGAKAEAASGNITLGEPTYATGFTKAVDDIWIAAVHSSDQVAHTFTNWTQIAQANGGSTTSRLSVWYHRYAGSNPNFVVTHAAGQSPIGGIVAFRGCLATGSPVNVSSTIAAGNSGSIAHTAVTPTLDETKLLVINGAADDNARTALTGYTSLLNEASNLAFITILGTPDGSVSIWQKNANVGQTVSSGTVTVTMTTDPWAAMLLALEGAAAAATPITKDVPADALGSYADALTVERRGPPRWVDSVVFDLQSVGTTPKEANFTADPLGSYADAPVLRLAFFTAPAADSMAIVDQAATVTRALIVSLSDALGGYADQLTVSFRLNATPSDSLGQYSDQAPTIREDLLVTPTDSLPAYADSTNGFFNIAARPSDDLNQWTDQRTVFISGTAALTAEPPADSLPAYTDTSNAFVTFAVRPSDDLNQWADQRTVFITGLAALTAEPLPDSLNNWTDTLTSRFGEFVLPAADSMTMADQLGVTLLTVKSASFTDALPSYSDQATVSVHKSASFSDALGSYSDAATAAMAKNVSRSDAAANWLDQVTGGAQSLTRIGWQDSVVATTLPVRIGWVDSVTIFRSLGTDRIVQLTSIKPVYIDTPNLLYGYNHGFVTYLVDELGNYIVDENGNRIITSGLIDNLAQGDSVAITRTQQNITPIERSFTDAIPAKIDSLQVTRGIIPVDVSLSDALPVYTDAPQITQVGLLTPSFSDALGGYNDLNPAVTTTGQKQVAQSDALPAYTDAAQIGFTAALTIAASDSLENYVDDATINTSGSISVPLSDAIDAPIDFIQAHRTGALTVSLSDTLGVPIDTLAIDRAGILKVTASDNLAGYADSPTHGRGIFYSTPADSLANYLDVVTRGGTGLIQAALSDNLGQYSDSLATFANFKAQPPADDLAAYGDALTGLLGINIVNTDGLGLGLRYDDLVDIRAGSIEEIRFDISDDLNQWADAASYNRSYFAIHLSGTTTDRINLTGKVVEEQISLNGKAADKADITGELSRGTVMNTEDMVKLKIDPVNEFKPYIVFDTSERCRIWANHSSCDGILLIGKVFHIYCDCDCHKHKDA